MNMSLPGWQPENFYTPFAIQPLLLRASPLNTFHNSLHQSASRHAAYTTVDPSADIAMAHRALLLPEIVTRILQNGREEHGLLYNSLFVNHLFFQEASRILWSVCDYYRSIHPTAHDLGTLVLREDVGLERAKFYSNLVREIHFNYDYVIKR